MGQFTAEEVIAKAGDNPELQKILKGFLSGEIDAGMHAHVILNNQKRTAEDGAHRHLFILSDGTPVLSEEDGEHWHVAHKRSDFTSFEPSEHTHEVIMPDGTTLITNEDGWHSHNRQIETTGLDGSHQHWLPSNDGMGVFSESAATFIARFKPEDVEESEMASDLLDSLINKGKDAFGCLAGLLAGKTKVSIEKEDTFLTLDQQLALAVCGKEIDEIKEINKSAHSVRRMAKKKKKKKVVKKTTKVVAKEDDETEVVEDDEVSYECEIFKLDVEKRRVFGIVLVPEKEDIQGDVISKEDIEETAAFYLKNARTVGLRHVKKADAEPIQSYTAPVTFKIKGHNGTQTIKKGSWILGIEINDDELLEKVKKKEFNAFSVGGFGLRTEID